MKNYIPLFLVLCFSLPAFSSVNQEEVIEEIEFTENVEELSPVKIREIKSLLKTMSPTETCMDEYLTRRKQLIVKLVASPAIVTVSVAGAGYLGAAAGAFYSFLVNSSGWAALGHVLGGGLIGAGTGSVFAVVDTTLAGVHLSQINTVLKTLGEFYLDKTGKKTEKFYQAYLKKNPESNLSQEGFVENLIDLDKSGKLCDGSLVKQPKIKLGTKLKFKVAKTKDILKHL